jgi:ABC-type uncharacterized transport system auxiliary subunit
VETPATSKELFYVPPFRADGLLSERALVYAHAGGTALEQYNYHFWVDSPRALLQQALLDELRSGLQVRVTREASRDANYSVNGRIIRFERASADGSTTAELALEMEFFLRHETVAGFSRGYTRSLKLAEDTPQACATALASASQEVVRQFVGELRNHLEK